MSAKDDRLYLPARATASIVAAWRKFTLQASHFARVIQYLNCPIAEWATGAHSQYRVDSPPIDDTPAVELHRLRWIGEIVRVRRHDDNFSGRPRHH
ncbi:hypothetical protein QCM77_22605 [Bradyrhizobium sp. SSUT18]|uniref:hypothetical protein n=1 Tax=Bradyrhizobium sp. SSUT18 TaxID=3040602 RepID=UPI002447C3CA|nr:hypothetical protein [Bradyrhizobium sp. SSUT18]MDH2402734.1 hypothetical protein [Bradyrhizobium sp. SSUT18]